MELRHKSHFKPILLTTLFACALSLVLMICVSITDVGNNMKSFEEKYITLDHGWTIIDSRGNSRDIADFPHIIEYGKDGRYTLESVLPDNSGLILSPVLGFYSNYVDFKVFLDSEKIYDYPYTKGGLIKGTGNTTHFIRLEDYKGKSIRIEIHCQLGNNITYQLNAPLLGSKASMMKNTIDQSIRSFVISSCMLILAVLLFVLYFFLYRKIHLDYTTLFMSIFALLFALYVFFESTYAKVVCQNSIVIYCSTFILLTLMPLPLIAMFMGDIDDKFFRISTVAVGLCFINFFAQTVLHFTGLANYRLMLPYTHATIICSILIMVFSLLNTDKKKHPHVIFRLVSATPIILGGCTDIFLLWINKPSFNNSFWFIVGVTIFVLLQFVDFIRSYFKLYHLAIKGDFLRDMAYKDTLSGLSNRNAYEQHANQLSKRDVFSGLGCIVADINGLKRINDTLGHQMGDFAIKEVGHIISDTASGTGKCYRTGGDEFIVLFESIEPQQIHDMAMRIEAKVWDRGVELAVPFSISVGWGCYEESDGTVQKFISRVDSSMYANKHGFRF